MTKAAHCLWLLPLLIATLSSSAQAQSQTTSPTDGYTPKAIEPGSPAGSYALSGFDTVNPYNGGLNFSLPLLKIAGRGASGYTVQLPIETRWRVLYTHEEWEGQSWDIWDADYNWWRGIDPGYGPGVMLGRKTGKSLQYCSANDGYLYTKTLTRLTFTAADGTEYQFRDQATGGQLANVGLCSFSGYSRGTVFITADGSAATFTSDTSINDTTFPGDNVFFPSGNLMFRDGTRYRIVNGVVTEIRDRNGNKTTFTYDGYSRVSTIKDSINRQVTIEYDVTDGAYGLCDRITYKGFNNTARVIRVSKKLLQDVLRSGQTLKTMSQLWPELNNASPYTYHNPLLVSDIWLPDGQRKYTLRYNSYSELARVELPTGGVYEYDWANGVTSGAASGVIEQGTPEAAIYRRVIEKRTYVGGTLEKTLTIGRPESTTTTSLGFVDLVQTGTAGAYSKTRRYFEGVPAASLTFGAIDPTSYSDWMEGKEYKTEILSIDGTTVLRREEKNWQHRAPGQGGGIDPRVVETVTTLVDTNQVAKTSAINPSTGAVGFDQFNNPTDIWEYDYGAGAAGALVRRTHTDYLTTNPINSINYTSASIHIRSLVTQTSIFDAAGTERARATNEYDNYTTDANHALLTNRSNISGLDSAFTTSYTTRGNATGTTGYLLTNGAVNGSISNYSQFDIAGNVVKIIDGRGFNTTFAFADCFGGPDGNATINSAPLELSSPGQASYAFATSVTNHLGHAVFMQLDYHLGRSVDVQDANGIVSSSYFNDVLDRPTQAIAAVNDATVKTQATFSYDDANRIVTTTSDLNAYNDNVLKTQSLYDNLGRSAETRQYEGGTNYIAIRQEYDGLGRPYRTSNPFRPWQSQSPVWTTQVFDALGRVTSVTTPDSAAVLTSYSGNTVTVTDQALRKRKSVTDALGRLKQVYEDPNGLNYLTSYDYDVLDDLIKVTQGTQQRFFMYDSLKRLLRARNPEQSTFAGLNLSDPLTGNSAWSVGYQYDPNGNLTQKTDARGVVSTYVYDALNRNTTIDYSDTGSINPDVSRFYDGAIKGVGRFWYNYAGGNISAGSNVEHTAIDNYDALGRPTVQRQLFKLNGTWGPTYQIARAYNRASRVISQTYPSGRAVSYTYDAAGRTSSFSGNLGDGVSRTYASTFVYNARNQVTQELFGTQTQLYHKLQYNIRGQLWDVRVSTGPDINGSWNRGCLQFFYESTLTHGASGPDNNGNVLKSNHYVPLDDTSSTWAISDQLYAYDSLNRLSSVSEYFVSSSQAIAQTGLQSYTYDRWGNRTINPASWGTGINVKQFSVDTATNRLGVPAGQSGVMSYDNAGNLTNDTYTGVGARTYDAENKMLTAVDNTGQTSRYTYDAEGHRVRRQVASGQEEWQIYGMDGELVAEYRASSPASAPEKEYGYRDGQLLITATGRFNVALAANGAVATASSTATGSGFFTTGAINGNYRGPWGNWVEGWNDNTPNVVPDWIQVDFAGSKTIDEISVFGLHDNYTVENTPTETQTFSLYGLIAFDVQYWNGSSWTTIPGGSVTGNNKVWRKFTFSPITTSKVRVTINAVPDAWSRVVEIQAFGTSAGGEKVQWLVPDHLGTPRIILDQTGSRTNVKRHDYLPFGEELFAGTGGRTVAHGYAADGVRQQFTSKERDIETGLDYFLARYYSSTQGRFTGVDPLMASAKVSLPQSWNRYSYCFNNPLAFIDPDGRRAVLDDYYVDRDGEITIDETPGTTDRFFVQDADLTNYTLVATLQRNNMGLVLFPDSGTGFDRYGIVDAGGLDRATGENVGQGDHFLEPLAAAALFGTINVLHSDHQLTLSLGDMSSSNGSDPWQAGERHHGGHGHNGNRSGLDIDFRYLNNNGVSFQSQTARSDPQFSVQNNQRAYDTARTFGFTTNYQGTNPGNNGAIQGVTPLRGHNDHGHLGFNRANANIFRRTMLVTRP